MTASPATGRLYPQLVRKPGVRLWQCLMSLVLLGLFVLVVQVGLSLFEVVLFGGFGPMMGMQADGSYAGPAPVLYGVGLRVLYVAFAVMAVAWAFTVRPGWVASVAERVRWRVALVVLPVAVLAALLQLLGTAVDGSRLAVADPATARDVADPALWVAVAVLAALVGALTDEVVFRGWLAQTFGAVLPGERPALVLSAAASAAGYAWWREPQGAGEVVCVVAVGLVLFAVATLTGGLETPFMVSAGLALALLVPYAASTGLDVAWAPRSATWVDVVAALLAGTAGVLLARRAGAGHRGRPEGEARALSDLSQARGVR
jgi:uncharacterized protein